MKDLARAVARSGDLALAAGLVGVLVALMAAGSVHPLVDLARLVAGLVFVLFVPGYCLLAALLPRAGALDRAERIGISIGASVALIPVLALLLDRLPWGLRPWPIVIGEGVFTLALAALALWQRAHVHDEVSGAVTRRPAVESWMGQLTPVERVTYPLVLVVAMIATVLGVRAVITPTHDDLMTELYVLGRGDLAERFPRVVETGEPVSVKLGLVNRELFARTYRVEAWARDAWSTDQGTQLVPPLTVAVAPYERLEWPLTWQMARPGDDQAIDVVLYVEDDTEPYRRVRLWLDVLPPSSAASAQAARPDLEAASQGIEADLTSPSAWRHPRDAARASQRAPAAQRAGARRRRCRPAAGGFRRGTAVPRARPDRDRDAGPHADGG